MRGWSLRAAKPMSLRSLAPLALDTAGRERLTRGNAREFLGLA